MTSRPFLTLLLAASLSACQTAPKAADASPAPKKHAWYRLWSGRPEEAAPYLEYRKARNDGDNHTYSLSVRNTHATKTIAGEVRTTLETPNHATKVISESFTLTPNETQKLVVYPDGTRVTYEVTAAFRE